MIIHLAGSNRDPHASADGSSLESFNPHRGLNASHLAFGHGFHRCIGAELAKMELRAAYVAIAKRFPDLAIADVDLGFRPKSIVYGIDALPVRIA